MCLLIFSVHMICVFIPRRRRIATHTTQSVGELLVFSAEAKQKQLVKKLSNSLLRNFKEAPKRNRKPKELLWFSGKSLDVKKI